MGRGFAWLDAGTPDGCLRHRYSLRRLKNAKDTRSRVWRKSPGGMVGLIVEISLPWQVICAIKATLNISLVF